MKVKYCAAMCAAALLSSAVTANDNVEVYGQVAISMYSLAEDGKDTVNRLDNESRVGFRGTAELERAPTLVWQIEGNNVGTGENSGDGQLGLRDTFGGFEDESWGRVRFGRFLTPAYAIIDWPYSNPGLGNVFDWGSDIAGGAYYDRQADQISWDSPNWNGFNMVLAAGRGNNLENSSSNFYGASAHYRVGTLQLHAGYEYGTERRVEMQDVVSESLMTANSDYQTYIAGFEVALDHGIGLFGAYKVMTADYADHDNGGADAGTIEGAIGQKQDQTAYSIGATYDIGHWHLKVGYSANSDLEIDSRKVGGTADSVLSGQAIYFLDDSALVYFRAKTMELNDTDFKEVRLGIEYYF
ncbi:porin [Thaumasiovibrio sp. DFM-14]|uniref:porin n=1 Tax=Thaumasiovibrio sp. DFM-14 TaxID=3384792 RepID=UPI0039A059FB